MIYPKHARLRAGAAMVAAVLSLAACGGGGGDGGGTQAGTPPVTAPSVQAPAITVQPGPQSLAAGGTATFSVTASGADLAYQWQRDGKDIAGATSATYTLANVQSGDTGAAFGVVVKNGGGSVTSGKAVLTVLPASARGVSLLAGHIGGVGNLDGAGGRMAWPSRIALSPSGVLYVADDPSALIGGSDGPQGNTVLRTVNLATGEIATVNATPLRTTAMVFDAAGNLYEATATAIYRTIPGGQRTLFAGSATANGQVDGTGAAARFTGVAALAFDALGNLYVADHDLLRRMSPDGSVTTVAGGAGLDATGYHKDGTGAAASFHGISALAIDAGGNVQAIDSSWLRVVTPAGVVGTRSLKDNADPGATADALGIAADKAGNVYLTDTNVECRIRKVAPDGTMSDLAGAFRRGISDGKGAAANFCRPVNDYYISWQTRGTDLGNLVVDAAGNMIVADTSNQTIRRVTLDGDVTTLAGRAASTLVNVDGKGAGAQFVLNTLDYRVSTSNWPFNSRSQYALAADAAGNVYVAENDRIRKIAPDGTAGTLPLQATDLRWADLHLGGLAFGGNALLGDTTRPASRINADGSLAALAGVDKLGPPDGVIVDAFGNLYVKSSSGATPILRRFAPDGTVTTLPDATAPLGYADAEGNIWGVKADGTVTRLGQDGKVTVVRAVSATAGAVPLAVARDRAGNLYVAWHEKPNWYSVHKITPAGTDSIIAGTPDAFGVRPGAPGSLGAIDALTVGMDGNVYVLSENAVLRIVQ